MRRAATLVLLALLMIGAAFAQTPAGSGSTPQTPPPAPGATAPPNTGEDTQKNTTTPGTSPGTNQPVTSGNPVANPPGPGVGTVDQIAAGTEIRATLDTPLSTKTSKPGDRFTATIAEPARGNNDVVIPTGARVEGEVAEADDSKTMAALKDKSSLSVRFRDVVLPDGQTLPLTATLISVNTTNGMSTKRTDNASRLPQGDSGRDIAKGTGVGSGPGTAFGTPLKGLAIGTLAGGGYVLSIKGKDVNLPAQTGMVIRLDQPISATVASTPPQR
ncbi:MAG TPA: hypothetical protein VKH81_25460 [Candidatus Angelobacter sp.]|nr:hypothetical protein [Candidatus Angelobacter sp.]